MDFIAVRDGTPKLVGTVDHPERFGIVWGTRIKGGPMRVKVGGLKTARGSTRYHVEMSLAEAQHVGRALLDFADQYGA